MGGAVSETLHIDATHLEQVLDRFIYNLGCELTGRAEQQPTLRDRFAMAAQQGLLAAENKDWRYKADQGGPSLQEKATSEAYRFADAMLEARKPAEPKPETTP